MTYKVIKSGKPEYLSNKLQVRSTERSIRGSLGSVQPANHSLSITKEGFIYRGMTLMNMMNTSLRCEPNLENFKTDLREWVKRNIAIKPKSKFPVLRLAGRWPTPPPPPASSPGRQQLRNLITNYFQPTLRM